ncbi:rhomboid family intramembrane serine protease, partial [Pseudomonas putida]
MDASPEFPRQSRVPVFNMPGVVTLSIGLLMAIQALRE